MFKVNDNVKTTQEAKDRGYDYTGVITAIHGDDVVIDYSGIGTGERTLRIQAKYVEKV